MYYTGKSKVFIKWVLFLYLNVFAAWMIHVMDWFEQIRKADPTYISFLTIMLYIITSLVIGKMCLPSQPHPSSTIDTCWFMSDLMSGLGLLGTVSGLLIVFGPAFTQLDVHNTQSMNEAIKGMGVGMGTALVTTVVGLVCSMALKVQLVTLEHGIAEVQ